MKLFQRLIDLFKRDSIPNLIKKANKKAKKEKVQYLVVPFIKGQYICVPGYEFMERYNKEAKKQGLKKLNYPELLKLAIYKTTL